MTKLIGITQKGSPESWTFFVCTSTFICDAMRELVPSVQFKNQQKHPWRRVTFSKVAENCAKHLIYGNMAEFESPVIMMPY